MHDEGVKEINPDFDALLVFLSNWEAIERSALGRILTAGQLADRFDKARPLDKAGPDVSIAATTRRSRPPHPLSGARP